MHRDVEAAGIGQSPARSACFEPRPPQPVALAAVDGHSMFADPDLGAGLVLDVDREDAAGADHRMIDMEIVGVTVVEVFDVERCQHEPAGG